MSFDFSDGLIRALTLSVEGGIPALLPSQSFGENPVNMLENALSRAKVCRDRQNIPQKLGLDR